MNKAALRKQLREAYGRQAPESASSADAAILRQFMHTALYQESIRLFLYAGVGREISTMPLIEAAVAAGKTVALPKSYGNGRMEFFRYTGALTEGLYHIPEPVGGEMLIPTPSDLMVVPGLAFTRTGIRLGQGAGYYDRYLQQHPCMTVGLCRAEFLLEEIPAEWNDLPVNFVITEDGMVK